MREMTEAGQIWKNSRDWKRPSGYVAVNECPYDAHKRSVSEPRWLSVLLSSFYSELKVYVNPDRRKLNPETRGTGGGEVVVDVWRTE